MQRNFWQSAAIALISVIVTVLLWWIAFTGTLVTKTEAAIMIQTQSPYVKDQQYLRETLSYVRTELEMLRHELEAVKIEQARTNVILEKRR